MHHRTIISPDEAGATPAFARKRRLLFKLLRAAQPISRTEIARRLDIDKSTVTENVKPLIADGLIGEKSEEDPATGRKVRGLSFAADDDYFIGVNLGVRRSQVGIITLNGDVTDEEDFETPSNAASALKLARDHVEKRYRANSSRKLLVIGVSVPGMIDTQRQELIYAPNLNWKKIPVASAFRLNESVKVVVENDSTAAAMYEARVRLGRTDSEPIGDFILVRSGTGIGVGLVIGGEAFRGSGSGRGVAGEFGHMTIVAGGKPCVCGNRGCWEKYASAASAASLFLGDRPPGRGESVPRFIEIVNKAENGENRSRRTLEKIGDYLGIGIANVIMGIGIPKVIISGRLVYGWEFIQGPLHEAIRRSMIGKIEGWSVEPGEPVGSAIGGALEVAVEEFLSTL